MPTNETHAEEVHRLRNTLRDLVAFSTLPVVWAGRDADGVTRSFAEILLKTLFLDLVYVRFRHHDSGHETAVALAKGRVVDAEQVRDLAAALSPWLTRGGSDPPASVLDPLSGKDLRVGVARFGHVADEGVVVACAQRSDFPSESDRILLGVGTNQTAVVLHRKRAEEALLDADRRKDEFLALLAHELRNPLAPIRNGLQVIRLTGRVSDDVARTQEMMDRQLTHMVRLIDDLLDISRISQNKMELRRGRVALAEVMRNAVETARPAIDAAGHELSISLPEQPAFLDADLIRLAQVFSNLLTNSAKYTPHGGRIGLTAERHGGAVVVSVRDTGIGIPVGSVVNIFNMFSQVDRSIERNTGGLGIGLALVKGLVEMHGGSVKAQSPGEGLGSTFTVTLPVVDTVEAQARAADGQPVARAKRRVLVVDDNRDGADSLSLMLRLRGDVVQTSYDGVDAVQQAEQFRPEVVLMDVGMPRLSGLDATRRIREQRWGWEMVIIALTGWGQESDRERSHEAGCNGHLVKPVNLKDLETLLRTLKVKAL